MNDSLSPAVLLAIYCALVLLASLAGGWLLLALRPTHTRLQTAVSLVAGLMLGMAILHFIPHGFHQLRSLDRTVQWALGGFMVMFFLQRFFPHHHHDVADHAPTNGQSSAKPSGLSGGSRDPRPSGILLHPQSASQLSWVATTVGMTLHSLVGGVALAAALAAEGTQGGGLVGLGTALVIILHKPFDAMAVATLMAASGCSRFSRHLLNSLFACVTPLGAVLFYFGASHFFAANPVLLGSALAFCAGTFLCIACADLLPELQFHSHDRLRLSLALLAGIGIALLIGKLGRSGHIPHHTKQSDMSTGSTGPRLHAYAAAPRGPGHAETGG
jgi:zinc and cadmium transporter